MGDYPDRKNAIAKLKRAIASSLLLVGGCSHHPAGYGQSGPQTALLRETLLKLNMKDPASDARAHVAAGDRRPVGVYGYACSVPGPLGHHLPMSIAIEIRCLDGTTDVAESGEHQSLIEQAVAYANAYDQELHRKGVF